MVRCPWCGEEVSVDGWMQHQDQHTRVRQEATYTTESIFPKRYVATATSPADKMLSLIHPFTTEVFKAALYAAKTTLLKGSPRRVFIQDFAAALNRRRLLSDEDVEEFCRWGYEYMKNPEATSLSEWKRKKIMKNKNILINRLAIALTTKECANMPRTPFRKCVHEMYPIKREEVTRWVERTIRKDPESLVDIMKRMGISI